MKHPVQLPDKLTPRNTCECNICGEERARWKLRVGPEDDAVCSLCYLYEDTSVGVSEEFRQLCREVRKNRSIRLTKDLRLYRIEDADTILAAVVLTGRMFVAGVPDGR